MADIQDVLWSVGWGIILTPAMAKRQEETFGVFKSFRARKARECEEGPKVSNKKILNLFADNVLESTQKN